MSNFKQLLVASLLAIVAINVQALPLAGSLDMGGGAYVLDASGARLNDASLATAVDFPSNNLRVVAADGDFTSLFGSLGSIQDFTFDPFVGPKANFWVVGGFSYELTGATRYVVNDPASFLVIQGTGIISATGFDDTAASWSYTSSTTGNGAFSWSATLNTKTVPEPAVLALLSVGLIGFGLRKKI